MEREDEDIDKLLGEIPGSAPPLQLEEFQLDSSLSLLHSIALKDSPFHPRMPACDAAIVANYSDSASGFHGNLIRHRTALMQEPRKQFAQEQKISYALANLSFGDDGLQMQLESRSEFNGDTDPQHPPISLPFDPLTSLGCEESVLHNEPIPFSMAQKLQQLSVREAFSGVDWNSSAQARESYKVSKKHLMQQLIYQRQGLPPDACCPFLQRPNLPLSRDNEAPSQKKHDFAPVIAQDRHDQVLLQHVLQKQLLLEQSPSLQGHSFQNCNVPLPAWSISSFQPGNIGDDGWNQQNCPGFPESGSFVRHLTGKAHSYVHSHSYGHGKNGQLSSMFLEQMSPAAKRDPFVYPCCNAAALRCNLHDHGSQGLSSLCGGKLKDNTTNGHLNINGHVNILAPNYTSLKQLMVSKEEGSQHLQVKFATLEEVEGRICEVAKDQHGCRFLQRKFEEGTPDDVQRIFQEICGHILELMSDPFGNYLIQKLLMVCDDVQRMQIVEVVTINDDLVTISLNMHGTRAVQKLIETLKTPEQIRMVISSLRQGVVTLIKDLNGNHVVRRCLQHLSSEDNQFIFDAVTAHCVEIASHQHGCCVLQRCIDFASRVQQECLVAEITANALVISQDPFGNYVIQYILELGLPWASVEVIAKLERSFPHLSMQKFSSNVVEKCLKIATEDSKAQIVNELISSSLLGHLLHDPYANYVIQSALQVSKGALYSSLVNAIRPYVPALRNSPYGRRILSRTHLRK